MGLKEAQQILQSSSPNDNIKKSHKLFKPHKPDSSVYIQHPPSLGGKNRAIKILLGILIYSLLFFLYVIISSILFFILMPDSYYEKIDYFFVLFSLISVAIIVVFIPAISKRLYGKYINKLVFIILTELLLILLVVSTTITYASSLFLAQHPLKTKDVLPKIDVLKDVLLHPIDAIVLVPISTFISFVLIFSDTSLFFPISILTTIFYFSLRIKLLKE